MGMTVWLSMYCVSPPYTCSTGGGAVSKASQSSALASSILLEGDRAGQITGDVLRSTELAATLSIGTGLDDLVCAQQGVLRSRHHNKMR